MGGFGGSIPCAQTKGAKKFYTEDQTPEKLLHSGHYEKVPIMFGANSHEGSFVYATVYNSYFVPNNLVDDEKFLRNDLVHQLLQTVEIGNSYPVEYMVEDAYFKDWQMGDLELMRPAIIDMLGVFFLKASSYEFVTESADQGSQAYWYLSRNKNENFHRAKLLYVGTRWSTRLRTKAPLTLFSRIKPR